MKMRSKTALILAVALGASLGGTPEASASTSRSCLTGSARSLLARIESRFGAVQVISTCRPGARIAGSGRVSRHASGNAVDFNAGSRKGAIIQWLLANHHSGGTMTYSRMDHIHVDIGPRFVSLAGRTRTAARSDAPRGRMGLGGPRRSRR